MNAAEEQELVARAKKGDASAFSILIAAHQRFVYNLALRTLRDPQEASDLVQEAFLRAWLAIPRFRGEARFSTWLYRIATNLCYNRLPRMRRELAALPIDEALNTPAGERNELATGLEKEELCEMMQQEIGRLKPAYQMLLQLRYQQELSYNEIAVVMSMPSGSVKTGLHRAHRALYRALHAQKDIS